MITSISAQAGGGDSLVAIAKAGIDTTITLGDWLKSHPGDSVTADFVRWDPGFFCRSAVARSTFANRRTIRYAGFYMTRLPALEELPADTARIADRACRLREIYLETEVMDSLTAIALSDSIAGQIGRTEPRILANEGATGGHSWTHGKTWTGPRATVVVAIAPPTELESPGIAKDSLRKIAPRKVVMVAYSSSSVFQHHGTTMHEYEEEVPAGEWVHPDARDADSAIAWAGLPSVAADLQAMLAQLGKDGPRPLKTDSAFIRAFRKIRDTAPDLEPARAAAALLAAELIRYALPFPQQGMFGQNLPLLRTLHKIVHGPSAEYSVEQVFDRAWLWEAYRLDSLGRAGHLAFVRMLKRGFRRDAECSESVGFYSAMIERGEAHLRRGNTDPLVHFYVGVAYKSIFELAHTQPGNYVEKLPTKSEAEAARLRAIDHFRAALPGLQERPMRRDAWYYAMRLMLGRTGSPWLFCASD